MNKGEGECQREWGCCMKVKKGEKKWDNCNCIINQNIFKKNLNVLYVMYTLIPINTWAHM